MNYTFLGGILFLGAIVAASAYTLSGQSARDNLAEAQATANSIAPTAEAPQTMNNVQLAQASFKPENLPLALHIQDNDRVIGDPNAPVTIIEYASMTCSHCANFHKDVYPEIKTNYIATGKVKWVLRALPWDDAAVYISKLNRCVPADQFETVSSAFFNAQEQWIKAADPLAEVKKIGRLAGITEEKFNACAADQALTKEVKAMKRVATEVLRVKGTPAFFINGERVEGGRNYKFMSKAIDAAYAAATQAQG